MGTQCGTLPCLDVGATRGGFLEEVGPKPSLKWRMDVGQVKKGRQDLQRVEQLEQVAGSVSCPGLLGIDGEGGADSLVWSAGLLNLSLSGSGKSGSVSRAGSGCGL